MKKTKKPAAIVAGVIPALTAINVTQKDIDNADQGNGEFCAIAVAVRRALGPLGEDAEISIGGAGINNLTLRVPVTILTPKICIGGKLVAMPEDEFPVPDYVDMPLSLVLPQKAGAFITKFDNNRNSVKPTTFSVKLRA